MRIFKKEVRDLKDLFVFLFYPKVIEDDDGAFGALASLTYFTADQLSSGNFSVLAPGIIDVRMKSVIISTNLMRFFYSDVGCDGVQSFNFEVRTNQCPNQSIANIFIHIGLPWPTHKVRK